VGARKALEHVQRALKLDSAAVATALLPYLLSNSSVGFGLIKRAFLDIVISLVRLSVFMTLQQFRLINARGPLLIRH